MRGAVVVATLAACGRFHFDVPDAGTIDTAIGDTLPVGDTLPRAIRFRSAAQGETLVSASSLSVTIPATGAGDLLVVGITSGTAASSVIDDRGNAYTSVGARATYGGASGAELWYAKNSIPDATVLTVGIGPGSDVFAVWVLEVSGADLDAPLSNPSIANDQGPSTTINAPVVMTTRPDALVVSVTILASTVTGIRAGNPFTLLPIQNGNDMAYFLPSASGSYGAAWDAAASTVYCAISAAFTP